MRERACARSLRMDSETDLTDRRVATWLCTSAAGTNDLAGMSNVVIDRWATRQGGRHGCSPKALLCNALSFNLCQLRAERGAFALSTLTILELLERVLSGTTALVRCSRRRDKYH